MRVFEYGVGDQHSEIATKALQYLKIHRKDFLHHFTASYRDTDLPNPLSIFLAGSPGAGKTEYGISLIGNAQDILRVEADEIRRWFPMYNGANASQLQQATSRGVDLLFDYIMENGMSFLLDSTFTPWRIAEQNVRRCLSRNRDVQLHYIYQDFRTAWEFTKKREMADGRHVPREAFMQKFLEAYENVRRIKVLHGNAIDLTVAVKNFLKSDTLLFEHVEILEEIIHMRYTLAELQDLLF